MAKKLRHNGRIDDSVSVYTEKRSQRKGKTKGCPRDHPPVGVSDIGGRYKMEVRNSSSCIIIIMQHTGK